MAINYDHLMNLHIPEVYQTYTKEDSMLYALSLGVGKDPTDLRQLPFVYEENQRCLPSFGTVLGHPGFWLRDMETGVAWEKIVHAQHELIIHRPLPVSAEIIGYQKIVDVIDRGADRGAMIIWQRSIVDAATKEALCTINQYMLARADGGFGGPGKQLDALPSLPDREADAALVYQSDPQMALLYRLNGDWNPLHADPKVAKVAGFDRPILHGLATWGRAATDVMSRYCDNNPDRISRIAGRFTAPVYPGESFRTEMWQEGNNIHFRVVAVERNLVAINNGLIEMN